MPLTPAQIQQLEAIPKDSPLFNTSQIVLQQGEADMGNPLVLQALGATVGGGGAAGERGGGFDIKPDYSVIGPFLPGLNQLQRRILRASGPHGIPKNEQALRNTVLGSLTSYLTGEGGAPGTLFNLPGQYTSEIDEFVSGQMDTQKRALATQYSNAQQDIIQNAAVQGFNPAGALGMLAQNYAQQLADIDNNASTLTFQAGEAQRNRIAQSILPTSVGTSEFGLDIPNRRIAALSGAFGNIAGGASSLSNAAFTPAQIRAQLQAAQMAADVQERLAQQEMANRLLIAQISGQFGVDAAKAGRSSLNPWEFLAGNALGSAGQGIGTAIVNKAPDLLTWLRENASSWYS